MSVEKNNNPESSHLVGRNDQERLKQKQSLQREIQKLKDEVQKFNQKDQLQNAFTLDQLDPHKQVENKLAELENLTNALDDKNTQRFQVEVGKIAEQLENIKSTRQNLASLKKWFSQDKLWGVQSAIQEQLSEHNPRANDSRAESYFNIANISKKAGENPVANFFAGLIEKLV